MRYSNAISTRRKLLKKRNEGDWPRHGTQAVHRQGFDIRPRYASGPNNNCPLARYLATTLKGFLYFSKQNSFYLTSQQLVTH